MDSYAVHSGDISPQAKKGLDLAIKFFDKIPYCMVTGWEDYKSRKFWSCHALCLAFNKTYPDLNFHVAHGFFHSVGHEHAWLWHKEESKEHHSLAILDLYPVGGVNPFLVSARSVWRTLYIESNMHYREKDFDTFKWQAQLLCETLAKVKDNK